MSEVTVLSLWKGRIKVRETMSSILDAVSLRYGVSIADLKGPARYRTIAWPRQEAMWRMVETGRVSLPQIGAFLNRDHTTILHGWRQHGKRNGLLNTQETPRVMARVAALVSAGQSENRA